MVRFSIVVPVYNVEEYIDRCLNSILKQTFEDYEVIVVNDGSPDNSQKIIDKYVKKDKRFKSFLKENGGLSDARNYGVQKAKGEYLVFVDSDDDINKNLLFELNKEIELNNVDVIKYGINIIDGNDRLEISELFHNLTGEEAFAKLINSSLFVTAWSYAYKRKYWIDNKFMYAVGRIHEDYGLTPYVVINASSVSSIDVIGYNYYIRDNSIMSSNDEAKLIKKNEDCLVQFDNMINLISASEISNSSKDLFRSYIANGLVTRCVLLEGKLLKDYIYELKNRKLYQYLLTDTLGRRMKMLCFKYFTNFYIKHFVK